MSPSFHNPPLFFPGKAAVSEDRSLPLGSGTHFMPAAISACYQRSFWISHRVGSLDHLKSFWRYFNIFLLSFGPKYLWDVTPRHRFFGGVIFYRRHSWTLGFTNARISLRCSSTALAPEGDVGPTGWFEEQIAPVEKWELWPVGYSWIRHAVVPGTPCWNWTLPAFQKFMITKKWKSPRTTEIKFRDVYCNPILYTVYRLHPKRLLVLSSSMRLGFVKRACPRNPMDCHRFSPIEMATLWAIYIIYRILYVYPHFQRYPSQFNPKSWLLKPN